MGIRPIGMEPWHHPFVGLPLTPWRRMNWMRAHTQGRFRNGGVYCSQMNQGSHFSGRTDGWRREYHRMEIFADACVAERVRFSGDTVLVWVGILRTMWSSLRTWELSVTEMKSCSLIVPFVLLNNARPHVARVCRDFLAANSIVPLERPLTAPTCTPSSTCGIS